MTVPVNIIGENNEVAQVIDGGLVVSQYPAPAKSDSDVITLPNVEFMTINGDKITADLNVDGSVNEVNAYIEADNNSDIYIKVMNVLISDTKGGSGLVLSDFGALPALTNGIIPYFEANNIKYPLLPRGLQTNFDFVRIGSLSPNFGSDETAYRIKGAKTGSGYDYLSVMDLTSASPGKLGIRLAAGTKQKLGVLIRDDISSLDAFEIGTIGYKRLP